MRATGRSLRARATTWTGHLALSLIRIESNFSHTQKISKFIWVLEKRETTMVDDQFSKACKVQDGRLDDINSVLPDEILEEILAKLPLTSIARVGIICKKWKEVTQSTTFINKVLDPHKSWYLVLTAPHHWHAYDRALGKWRNLDIPSHINITLGSPFASASGLICIIPEHESTEVYVCNPIAKLCRRLVDRPMDSEKHSMVSGLSISVGRNPLSYTVEIVRSCGAEGLYGDKLAIDVYSSDKLSWETLKEGVVLPGYINFLNCVICGGVLYTVIQSIHGGDPFALWAYDLSSALLEGNLMPFPYACRLKTGHVMNIKGKLLVAVEVEKQPVHGISLWLLKDKELVEVAMAPDEYCGRLSGIRSCNGFDETIYIWDCVRPHILMFDMVSGQWSWATKYTFIGDFNGVCFEPRLDTVP